METNTSPSPQRSRLATTSFIRSLVDIMVWPLSAICIIFVFLITSYILNSFDIIVWPFFVLYIIFGIIAICKLNGRQLRRTSHGLAIAGVIILSVFFAIVAVTTPPRSRIDAAKWSEGKALMETIATAILVYATEKEFDGEPPRTLGDLGFVTSDFDVTYFGESDFTFSVSSMNPLAFTIVCTPGEKPKAPKSPKKMTYNQDSIWTSD